jgi:pyruvate kinase
VTVGDRVLMDDGLIDLVVLDVSKPRVRVRVVHGGQLRSHKGINLPGVDVSAPSITDKDRADITFAIEQGLDYLALSFVRRADDIASLRALVPKDLLIVAKIEKDTALANIRDIIDASDAVMVARGDLGIEIPYEELPIVQRRIVKSCLRHGKPVIVATHMLESMIESPMPTRAEVTDVANAVFEQADAIMLSGETTVGKYPLKCIEVFDRIARRIERSGGAGYPESARLVSPRQKLVKSAVVLANELKAQAMLVFTRTGNMARYTGWMRPRYSQIYALCETPDVANALVLNWGVTPFVVPFDLEHPERTVELAIQTLIEKGRLERGNTVVIVSSISAGRQTACAVQTRVI